MRMFVISLCILLALVGLWVWFYYTSVEPVTNYYWESLSDLLDIIDNGDWETAKKDILLYYNEWDDVRSLWIYFLNQRDIDNIDSSIRRLYIFIKNEDKTLAQAELEHLIILFNVIDENESLTLENIF